MVITAMIMKVDNSPKIEPISNLEMKPGEQLTITCVAMGKPLPEVAWIKNGKSLNLVDKSVRVEEIKFIETKRKEGHFIEDSVDKYYIFDTMHQ
ncbi:hypothetical protein X801_01579 [Opisthorchis viverrini]|uniref:Ig-like domain-containing protein n=1 Tax=Opisthorchis viverrini TaxID=6198 RepID=A0A1S8X708_OPIVI|nr:hypothetical protein X801_01579 [Opisthorchis viverrini]